MNKIEKITVETESHAVKSIRSFWTRCRHALRKKGIVMDMFEDWWNMEILPLDSKETRHMDRQKYDDGSESWMKRTRDDYYEGVANADGTGYKIVFTVDMCTVDGEGHGYFYYEERNAVNA